jgi:hypothetical protein
LIRFLVMLTLTEMAMTVAIGGAILFASLLWPF